MGSVGWGAPSPAAVLLRTVEIAEQPRPEAEDRILPEQGPTHGPYRTGRSIRPAFELGGDAGGQLRRCGAAAHHTEILFDGRPGQLGARLDDGDHPAVR